MNELAWWQKHAPHLSDAERQRELKIYTAEIAEAERITRSRDLWAAQVQKLVAEHPEVALALMYLQLVAAAELIRLGDGAEPGPIWQRLDQLGVVNTDYFMKNVRDILTGGPNA
jgi:hypothetical protein